MSGCRRDTNPPFFFSSRRRHTRSKRDWSSDVCSSDLWGSTGEDAMAGFLGADTDQLREHAELMRDRARSLEGIRTRVSMLVAYGAEWEGEDAAAFRERWRSEIAPRFDERVSAIEDRGSSLEEQAE